MTFVPICHFFHRMGYTWKNKYENRFKNKNEINTLGCYVCDLEVNFEKKNYVQTIWLSDTGNGQTWNNGQPIIFVVLGRTTIMIDFKRTLSNFPSFLKPVFSFLKRYVLNIASVNISISICTSVYVDIYCIPLPLAF